MKQHNIFGEIDHIKPTEEMEELTERTREEINYYGSDLNKLVAKKCRKDMTVINVDLAIYDYKRKEVKFIESKHSAEKLGLGQELFLKHLQKLGNDVFVVYGDMPYNSASIHSFKENRSITVDNINLIKFLNNKVKFNQLEII